MQLIKILQLEFFQYYWLDLHIISQLQTLIIFLYILHLLFAHASTNYYSFNIINIIIDIGIIISVIFGGAIVGIIMGIVLE